TAANAWWSNPLVSVGAGGISMNTSGTIYNAPASVTTTGAITADVNGVTFVTAPGVSLETNVAAHQISVNNHDFIWIETRMSHIDGSGSSSGIFIRDSAFVTVENSFLANYPGFGSAGQVRLINNRALLFRNMIIANNQSSSGINVYADGADSHHLWFDQVRVFNNGSGLFFRGNSPGVIRDMLVTRSIFQNNASFGISADQGIQNSLFMNVLTANNGGDGLDLRGTILSSGNTVMNLVSVNNGGGGLLPGDNSQFINLGFSDNSTDDVLAPVGTGNIYSGVLYSGQASLVPDDRDGRCTAVGAGSGMANDGDCSPEGPSDHTVISAFDLSDQFRGPNGSPAAYNIGLAWFMLANQYMGFGRSLLIPLSYPDNSHRGQCDGTALTGCDRYDWQLVNTAPSPGFRNALSCAGMTPAVTHTFTTGSYTFLRNSYEIATDAKWDLPMCMGDESCLFTPNLGAYQGHGGIVDSGCADLSADPTFGDVDFREMNTNGVP
ncbi:MAG: hypothetical protein KDK25_06775, partial [Leptospiraceae bacterium]|nr:hypothetical protein [Leptospiraceae bacterium]